MEFTQKEINDLFGLLKIELSKQELVSLIDACKESISFRCTEQELLSDETSIDTIIRFSQKESLVAKIKEIRPDLSNSLNQIVKNI